MYIRTITLLLTKIFFPKSSKAVKKLNSDGRLLLYLSFIDFI